MTHDHENTWLSKRHWMVALWPVSDDGKLKPHEPWRMAILHADTEEELAQQIVGQIMPFSSPFRIWAIEMTEDNSYIGSIEIKADLGLHRR